jgi:arginase
MERTYGWIGAPSAAGAHSPGVEKAPGALRAAGLLDALKARGAAVADYGDLELVPFAVDRDHRRAQNVAAVARVAGAVALRTGQALRAGATPLVVGGDCTILLGVLAGCIETCSNVGLVYLDAHPDLNTPDSVVQGALDWMGMAHVLAVEGALGELSHLGARAPLLTWDDVVFFACVESELTAWERELVGAHAERVFPASVVAGHAVTAAREARALLEAREAPFVVHFDVDALDFVDFPLADNAYQRNQGLTLDDALAGIEVFAESALFGGLVLTEVNPDHAPAVDLVRDFARRLAAAIVPEAAHVAPAVT